MPQHGALHVESSVEPLFGENTYLVWRDGRSTAWVVDPGLPPQDRQVRTLMGRAKLHAAAVLLTHGHADHIAGAPLLREHYPELRIVAPAAEAHMLVDADANLSAPFGFAVRTPPADQLLNPGDHLLLDDLDFLALDVAGHSPGGLAFYCAGAGVVFTGDALFAGSIGRYDFPGSSGARLIANIRQSLLTLPDETVVYSGHGPPTTIGEERRYNPALRDDFRP